MAAPTIPVIPESAIPDPADPEATFDAEAYAYTATLWPAQIAAINLLVEWLNANVGAQSIITVTGASHDLLADNTGVYHVFTNTSAKTVNVRADATHELPAGYTVTGENLGANDLTITPAVGVTIRPPLGGSLVVPSGGAFTLVRTAINSFKLIGDTVAE
jgi:hypothetical protein